LSPEPAEAAEACDINATASAVIKDLVNDVNILTSLKKVNDLVYLSAPVN
jgi:hypothetical protein